MPPRRRFLRSGGVDLEPPIAPTAHSVPEELLKTLAAMPSPTIVLGPKEFIVWASSRAIAMGLVRRNAMAVAQIAALSREVMKDGITREQEIRVRRGAKAALELRARGVLVAPQMVVMLIDDLAEERRVDAVRRDFVVNVSHELKTPVGALSLLAEAIAASTDDSEAVRRFADRMQVEAARLTSLINDLTQLSRLQSDEPLAHAEMLEARDVVRQAIDDVRVIASARQIEIQLAEISCLPVYGDRDQLVMALRNLLTNAIAYSEPLTRIAVGARANEGQVLIDVKDQGTGIAPSDLERIFERFYRVDPARSRATGGTGLGLAIVKHVCRNHGGECRVWSEVGVGSTFTLVLPLQSRDRLHGEQSAEGNGTDA